MSRQENINPRRMLERVSTASGCKERTHLHKSQDGPGEDIIGDEAVARIGGRRQGTAAQNRTVARRSARSREVSDRLWHGTDLVVAALALVTFNWADLNYPLLVGNHRLFAAASVVHCGGVAETP